MKFTVKTLLLVVFGAAIVGAIVYAFLPKPVPVDLATVTRGRLRVTVDEDGKTRIKERYIVSTPLAGQLLRIELDEGDPVTRGQTLLATLAPNDPEMLDSRTLAEAEAKVKATEAALKRVGRTVEQAQVALEFAESEMGRARGLSRRNAISEHDLENAEMLYRTSLEASRAATFAEEIARFELEMAKAALLRTRPQTDDAAVQRHHFEIHAPIDGRVLRVFQESATVLPAGAQLLELGDPQQLEVEIDVLSSDAVRISPGAKVLLEQWGGEHPLEGTVRLIEPQGFTKISALGVEEQRVNVIIDFVDPPQKRSTLGDGYRVEARIVVWEREDVLKVPTSALFRDKSDWAVFLAAGGRATLQRLRLGRQGDLEAEVIEGIDEGDQVILHPSDRIQHGVAIVPREEKSEG